MVKGGVDVWLVFSFLALIQLWGAAAIAAGLRARRAFPFIWGLTFGLAPLLLGLERGTGAADWRPLVGQIAFLVTTTLVFSLALPHLCERLALSGVYALMRGVLIMAGAAVLGAVLSARELELLSVVVGGLGFIFGAMWFGSGLLILRRR